MKNLNKTDLARIAGHCTGNTDVKHVDCGGELAVGGYGSLRLPAGLGFAQRGKQYGFGIDCFTYKTFSGFCCKCGVSGIFVRDDKKPRASTVKVKGIA